MNIWIDQAASKGECMKLLEDLGNNFSDQEASDCLKMINHKSKNWYINHDMLMELLRSQIMVGNLKGAAKVINLRVPNRRLKFLPWLGDILGS